MKFLFYYILRRFFVKLEFSGETITLVKGILLKKTAIVPLSAVVKITVRQTPLMRFFRAKEVTLFTLNGKLELFLNRSEQPPFLPEMPKSGIKPRFREVLFGAFIDTRALAGIVFFAAALRRIGRIIGSGYFDRIISALFAASEKLSETLKVIHVAVPNIAAFAAVFAACSWIFTFVVKLAKLSGFRLSRRGKIVYIKSGVFTLYETALVRNTAAVITRKTIICTLFRRSPVYYGKTMVFPAASEKAFESVIPRIFGILPEKAAAVKTPPSRLAAHCAVPLWVFGVSTALLFALYLSEFSFARLLKTALYCAVFASGYISLCGVILMKNTENSFGQTRIRLSFRRGTAVYSALIPREIVRVSALSQNIFQRSKSLCDHKLTVVGKKSYRARQLPVKSPLKYENFPRKI